MTRIEFEWNTESVPDGVYEARVVVSDERNNPAQQALTGELTSPPFVVDNRRPEISALSQNTAKGAQSERVVVAGKVVDSVSSLAELAYSLDGGDFLPILPKDGVLDDLVEEFVLTLPELQLGPHTIIIRATDGADNVTTAQILVQGPVIKKR